MNRFSGFAVLLVYGSMAWAQAPAAQAAPQAAAAPSQSTSISGCMTQSFGNFTVADSASSKTWGVKGSGSPLWGYANHVVKVQGLPDPQAASPLLYAQSVQDTGQACGNAQASAATPATPNGTAQSAAVATPTTAQATAAQPEPQQQPGGGVAQATPPAQPASPQAAQSGTTGVTTAAPQNSENKGTPAAGTQQGAIASNTQPAAASNGLAIFNGCVIGSVNNFQFKTNDGKVYRLQGNTSQLNSMVKRNVEITGEDFNGKAIQVNGARDLGTACK